MHHCSPWLCNLPLNSPSAPVLPRLHPIAQTAPAKLRIRFLAALLNLFSGRW